jgi:hypothetical protein
MLGYAVILANPTYGLFSMQFRRVDKDTSCRIHRFAWWMRASHFVHPTSLNGRNE